MSQTILSNIQMVPTLLPTFCSCLRTLEPELESDLGARGTCQGGQAWSPSACVLEGSLSKLGICPDVFAFSGPTGIVLLFRLLRGQICSYFLIEI